MHLTMDDEITVRQPAASIQRVTAWIYGHFLLRTSQSWFCWLVNCIYLTKPRERSSHGCCTHLPHRTRLLTVNGIPFNGFANGLIIASALSISFLNKVNSFTTTKNNALFDFYSLSLVIKKWIAPWFYIGCGRTDFQFSYLSAMAT